MGANSKIEWTSHTFNPWRGCARVHTGCLNCYAERMSKRNPGVLGVWGQNGTRVVAAENTWYEPLKWDKAAACCCRKEPADYGHEAGCPQRERPRVFCASLADVFEDWQGPMVDSDGRHLVHTSYGWEAERTERHERCSRVTMSDARECLIGLIDATPNLDWLLLTKRPENIAKMMPVKTTNNASFMSSAALECGADCEEVIRRNVWLLTSVSDQQTSDAMIPPLLQCRNLAPVLGLSMEPLVGPVDLSPWIDRLDFVIVGGESGHGARPMLSDWALNIREQCRSNDVPFFFKQGSQANWDDFKDFDSFPRFLQVREFPKASVS